MRTLQFLVEHLLMYVREHLTVYHSNKSTLLMCWL